MRKRILSLLIVLSLCLGLLPVTALAADGIELYVGGQRITESGCYANQDGTWTKVGSAEPASGQFYYDAATFTLTLNKAEITNNQTVNVAEGYTYDGSVIAFSQTADVSLKIVVSQGTSTITGKGGIRVESTTGNASLSIKGPGSLDVEPKGSNSGITLCSSKNTNLDIDGADVTASSPAQYGVYLISSTDTTSTSTITVNNGSLTTGGNGNVGIYYYWSGTSNAGTSSLTVSGNAVVDTRNSQIMAQNKETVVQVGAGSDGNGGIVFNGKSGTVYGDVTLQEDLEIGTDETLTIGKDVSLTVPDGKTLNNNGTINVESGGKLEGTPDGSGTLKIAPTITTQPQDVEVKENETATFTVKATGTEPLSYQWQQSTDNGSKWTNITGETNATYTIATTTMDMNGYQYRCVVENSIDEATSNAATLTVTAIPTYSIKMETDGNGTAFASPTSAPEGTTITLTAVPNSGYHFDRFEVVSGDITITNNTFTMPARDVTVKAVFDRDSSGGAHHPDAGSTTTTSSDRYEIETPSDVENGSVKVSPSKAEKGDTVTVTVTPDDGYVLDKLAVYDEDGDKLDLNDKGNGKFTFQMPKGNVSIEVSFVPIEDETPKADFSDVPADAWYAEAVQYVYENGLMTGTSDTTFSPDLTTSRSMIATILWRMAGSPVVNYAMDFADVPADQWYAEAVRWASSEGIVGGYGNGSFGTGDPITREQFAVMLYRFAQKQGYDVSVGENTNILSYTDVSAVSEYAIPAMQWAVGSGVITGMGDTLAPQGETTRAQAAMMLMRFSEQYA
ncbi:S-layer homology domain-containing protein [Butyricicoccus pullicaecorum]|uniref:Endoglucanase n=1 Tax=Butyricicoccus pullicaecorum TaxID=501571 RepID=A0A1Y4LFU1_9FIRM|nr:S-layer homology domain-containing protein [Butyricicoccus pullicaecorum]OUP55586.1 hypothetical protein B5F15_14405 [Butyricicoccus pullicaecorum]